MPIKIQKDLPARAILESENIFVMDEHRARTQDIRPLQIIILNLMPVKEETETQLLRALSNTPLQVDITFLMLESHKSKNTSQSHLNKFYIYLRTPMEVGTVFYTDTQQRDYFLAEFKGVERDSSYVYRVKSMDNCSVNELDRNNLRKGLTIHRKGKLTNEL